MKPAEFRRMALSFTEAEEGAHMGHADFRVRGKVFATLGWPDRAWAMVKLTPDEQAILVEKYPEVFRPVPGGWGKRGCTNVRLEPAAPADLRDALNSAWQRVAPKVRVRRGRK